MENKLSDKLTQYISRHLELCPACAEKYENFKKIMSKYTNVHKEITQNDEFETQFMTKQYEEFKLNLSAYVDNELDERENIKVKKTAITNPLAKQDLKDAYAFKQLLHSAFEKTKNDAKIDLSKFIISQMYTDLNEKRPDPFVQVILLFWGIIACITAGVIGILYL
jgi:anti-sigma factor RsiW